MGYNYGKKIFSLWGLACLLGLCLAGPAKAQDITYTGDGAGLQPTPSWALSMPQSLYPGTQAAPGVSNNTITVNYVPGAGKLNPTAIIGGLSGDNGAVVQNNTINMQNGHSSFVAGGYLYSENGGAVAGNRVSVAGLSSIDLRLFGGLTAAEGNVYNNSVIVKDQARIETYVYGGYGGYGNGNGNVYSNSVSLSGNAYVESLYAVTGGYANGLGNAYGNMVSLADNSEVYSMVNGGVAGGSGEAYGNSVELSGQAHAGNGVYGGRTDGSGSVYNNMVELGGNTRVGQQAYGGYAAGNGHVYNNTVSLEGRARVDGDIYGGYSHSGNATGNTVMLGGSPLVSGSSIYGGYSGGGGDALTDNQLLVVNSGQVAGGVYNFQYYSFTLDSSATGLSVANSADLSQSTVGLLPLSPAGGALPAVGQRLTLLHSTGGLNAPLAYGNNQTLKGASLLYQVAFADDANNVYADVQGVTANPQTKSYSEGRLAGLAFANQGADLIANQGIHNALLATEEQPGAPMAFVAMAGGSNRYDTGSHVDVDGFSLLAGIGWQQPGAAGKLLVGGFFEAGWGNYNSDNSFDNWASVQGDGDTSYMGGGILGRFEFKNNVYAEASARAGQVKNDFNTNDMAGGTFGNANYDSSSAYYGLHLGVGYAWQVAERSLLDIYTRYLWTHQDDDSVNVLGDPIDFDAANSHRWRTGARFSHAANQYLTPYAGAAFEYEFDGTAGGTAYGVYAIDEPELKGATGMGELGLRLSPGAGSPFEANIGAQGYIGARQGVTGSAYFTYRF